MKCLKKIAIILFISLFSSCLLHTKSEISRIKNPIYEYENETFTISDGQNKIFFNNVKSWNLTSGRDHFDYSVSEDKSKCVIIQTLGEVVINRVHTQNRTVYFLDFKRGQMNKIDENIMEIAISNDLTEIVYVKNYDYTRVNEISLIYYNTKTGKSKMKTIHFKDYGTAIADYPVTKICYENDGFILEFWSDAANYGIMRLDMVNDVYTFEKAFKEAFVSQ